MAAAAAMAVAAPTAKTHCSLECTWLCPERGNVGIKDGKKKRRNKETKKHSTIYVGGSFCMQWARGRSHYPA